MHREMFDDGAERQSGEKTECADKQCGPQEQRAEWKSVGGHGAGAFWTSALGPIARWINRSSGRSTGSSLVDLCSNTRSRYAPAGLMRIMTTASRRPALSTPVLFMAFKNGRSRRS